MDSTLLSTSGFTWATPVVFKAKEYKSASDALQAYITDYEGKQRKYYGRKSKYDKQFLNLFCPKAEHTSSVARKSNKSMEKSSPMKKLVEEVYKKLKKDEAETVQRSLSASMQLMERINKDKLPSPTRSTILGGRPSTGSIDTDVLLDARPMTHLSNGVRLQNTYHANQNRYKRPMEINGMQNPSLNVVQESTGHYDGKTSTKYEIKGMDSLLYNINQHNMDISKLCGSDSASESIDDLLMQPNRSDHESDMNTRNSSHLNNSLFDLNGSKYRDSLKSHNREVQNKFADGKSRPGTSNNSSGNAKFAIQDPLLRLPEQSRDLKDHTSNSMNDIKESFQSVTESLKDFNTNVQNSPPRSKRSIHYSDTQSGYSQSHKNLPKRYIDNYFGDSDATNSSIITGHMLKGALPHQQKFSKVSSTPKHGRTKQLRFENNDTTKSSVGQGLEIDDLTAIPPDFGQSLSKQAVSLDSSFFRQNLVEGERKNIVGILKGNSPGKARRAMSRVSFTTDDLLNSDPTGLIDLEMTRPRSRSLPRPLFPSTNEPGYREVKTPSSHKDDVILAKQYLSPQSSPNRSRRSNHDLHNPFMRKSIDMKSPVSNQSFNMSNVKESKYRLFLQSLMKEIDDSASSVATLSGNIGIQNSNNNGTQQQDNGCGFLERIQNLLASEQVPTVAQYLDPEDTHDSLTTEAILDGDRSWEKRPSFKPPTEVKERESEKTTTIFDRFMKDCMEEAQIQEGNTISSNAQPGSLEALKNMLFTIQSLSTSQDEENQTPFTNGLTGYDEAILDETDEANPELPLDDSISKLLSPETKRLLSNSYSKQPGGPSLATAMEHLTKLKDLVENNTD